MNEIEYLTDTIAILDKGRIMVIGYLKELR